MTNKFGQIPDADCVEEDSDNIFIIKSLATSSRTEPKHILRENRVNGRLFCSLSKQPPVLARRGGPSRKQIVEREQAAGYSG